MTERICFDGVLVLGAGLAGLAAALSAATCTVMIRLVSPGAKLTTPDGNTPPKSAKAVIMLSQSSK